MLVQLERPVVVLDLETTGTNPRFDRVVEIAALKIGPDGRRESLQFRVNPERPIPPEASAVHGITDSDVAQAPRFREIAAQVLRFLEDCDLAGFGIVRFDVPLLGQEFQRAGVEFSTRERRLIDAQRIFHLREPRTLAAALRFYCGKAHEDAHSAAADAEAAWEVLEAQCGRYPDLPRTIVELDRICNPRDPDALDEEGKLRWRDDEAIVAFGQKSGMTLRELAAKEPGYLRWMLNKDFSPEVKDIISNAIEGKFPER